MRALLIIVCAATLAFTLPALAEVRPDRTKPSWLETKVYELRAERDWLRDERRELRAENRRLRRSYSRDVDYALRLASSAYGVSLGELYTVARCESRLTATAQNRSSTAAGLFQFLDSTWASQGMDGFSVYDPVANALAAARIVRREGWRQWVCRPA